MPFQSDAQILEVIEESPIVMESGLSSLMPSYVHHHHHYPEASEIEVSDMSDHEPIEVCEPITIELVVEEIPGAPAGTKDPEPEIEVSEKDEKESKKEDENDLKSSKKSDKWDLLSAGAEGFEDKIEEIFKNVPKHSGYDTSGCERAIAYLEKFDTELSKAMRSDIDAILDADKVEKVRSKIDEGIARLNDRADKLKTSKKSKRKKSAAEEVASIVKEGQKITGVQGIYVTVPLLVSRIARVCINGTISGGHEINDLFNRESDKYKLTTRERAEVAQLIQDMGYYVRGDRGYLDDEDVDTRSSDNFDYAANYKG